MMEGGGVGIRPPERDVEATAALPVGAETPRQAHSVSTPTPWPRRCLCTCPWACHPHLQGSRHLRMRGKATSCMGSRGVVAHSDNYDGLHMAQSGIVYARYTAVTWGADMQERVRAYGGTGHMGVIGDECLRASGANHCTYVTGTRSRGPS